MADGTHIEWTDATWNPIRARDRETGKVGWFCTHASEGCRFCYAETFNRRLGTGIDYRAQDQDRIEIFIDEKTLAQPLHWRRPRKIFTLSMSDLFGEFIPDEMIDRVFAVMALAPQHTFQVLTKRAARMRDYVGTRAGDWMIKLPDAIPTPSNLFKVTKDRADAVLGDNEARRQLHRAHPVSWPLPNVWLMISAEDQPRADERIPHLLATPAAHRGVSLEPLLGPITLTPWLATMVESIDVPGYPAWTHGLGTPMLDWVIAGGESGPGARPLHPDWVCSLRDQCQGAKIAFFFKQWGAWVPDRLLDNTRSRGVVMRADGEKPSDDDLPAMMDGTFNFAGFQHFSEVGKKAAGRLLDGREWSEFPA